MIDFIFTIDYEIFGDGTGWLDELVYQPARRLKLLFEQYDSKFVSFVEIAELQKIDDYQTDPCIGIVKQQIAELHRDGFEIGLHLHPQWTNAKFENHKWVLDGNEYNLCTLSRPRIAHIVDSSLAYLREVVGEPDFTPLSFRAGNWLFQPTETAASVLAERGVRIDSSVFKGGLQRSHNLDYRPSLGHGYFWRFSSDVNRIDTTGPWMEVPVYSEMVAPWKLATRKRMAYRNQYSANQQTVKEKWIRRLDFLRFTYPLKMDFCRMTRKEIVSMMDGVLREDNKDLQTYRPIVAIGHTKDLVDFATIEDFLSFLKDKKIPVVTFTQAFPKLSFPPAETLAAKGSKPVQANREEVLLSQDSSATAGRKERAAFPRLALITPARNEAAFLPEVINSVVAQTVPPVRWVIVSDGSTDGTDEIVKKYAAKYDWIELVRLPERKERHFGGKVNAFYAGYSQLKDAEFDVVGNLDADITFGPDYFEFLLPKFAENSHLGVVGTPFREGNYQYDYRFTSLEHVSGACQLFRKQCFEDIGGYKRIKTGGVDLVAVITARMKGWETRSFLERTSLHHRKMSSANHSRLGIAFHCGLTDYTHGSDLVWELFRSLYQMSRQPIVLGGVVCFFGFLWGMFIRKERVVSPELTEFRKREQRQRLRTFIHRLFRHQTLNPS